MEHQPSAPRLRKLLSARELADFLGVHQNYVYDQAVNGDLPSFKFGGVRRFRARDVEAWLQAQMGHSSIMVTMDTYGHLFPFAGQDTMDRFTQVWNDERKNEDNEGSPRQSVRGS